MFNKKNRKSMSEAVSALQAEKTQNNGMQELGDDELSAVSGGVNPFANADRVPLTEYNNQTRKNI